MLWAVWPQVRERNGWFRISSLYAGFYCLAAISFVVWGIYALLTNPINIESIAGSSLLLGWLMYYALQMTLWKMRFLSDEIEWRGLFKKRIIRLSDIDHFNCVAPYDVNGGPHGIFIIKLKSGATLKSPRLKLANASALTEKAKDWLRSR